MTPRSYTAGELKQIQKSFAKQDVSLTVLKNSNIFENRKDLNVTEKDEVEPILSSLFKERIIENKAIFKAKQIEEYNILHNI
jgi:hypothetical protein